MATWLEAYTKIRDGLVAKQGAAASGNSGILPRTFAHDPFILLAEVYTSVESALVKMAGANYAVHGKLIDKYNSLSAVRSFTVQDPDDNSRAEWEKVAKGDTGILGISQPLPPGERATVDLVEWISKGKAAGGDSQWRFVGGAETAYRLGTHEHKAQVVFIVSRWDRCVALAAKALATLPTHPQLSEIETNEWWSAYKLLLTCLDVANDLPPDEGLWERIKGATKYSARETAEFAKGIVKDTSELAGGAAAELAALTGEALGRGVKGFTDEAGLTAYVVVAGAVLYYTL